MPFLRRAEDDLRARPASRSPPARPCAGRRAVASGPIPVSSREGSPTFTAARRSRRSSPTASSFAAGTYTRRIAVHFCPVFCVTSRATSVRNRFASSDPSSTSGPSTAALRLSARRSRAPTARGPPSPRSIAPVTLEPVKARTSWPVRWSRRSPALPQRNERAPSGRSFVGEDLHHPMRDQRRARGRLAHDRHPVEERDGRLLRSQAPGGEVEGVQRARPRRGAGRKTCWPKRAGAERPSWVASPSTRTRTSLPSSCARSA